MQRGKITLREEGVASAQAAGGVEGSEWREINLLPE